MTQTFTDKLAISLSLLCTLHCLAFPIAMVSIPSLAALQLDGESFHLWMLIAVIPTSIYALTLGCMKHKRYQLVILGLMGLAFMVSAVLFEETFGESGEKWFTVIGASLIAIGHYRNFRLCNAHDTEEGTCSEHQNNTSNNKAQ